MSQNIDTIITSDDQVDPQYFQSGHTDFIESLRPSNAHEPTQMYAATLLFIEKPNLTNAREVLRAYEIKQPLQFLVRKQATAARNKIQRGGTPPEITLQDAKEMLALDTLHDLKNCPDPVSIYQLISRLAPNLPANLRNMFLTKSPHFTAAAAKYLLEKHNVNITTAQNTEEARLVDEVIAKAEQYYKNQILELVIDNIVANAHFAINIHEANIAFIGCAYILVLCYNMHRLGMITSTKQIVLYDGYFQRIDGTRYVKDFAILFAKNLRKSARVANVTIYPKLQIDDQNAPYIPSTFNRIFQTDIKIQLYVDPQSGSYPYIEFNGKNYIIDEPKVTPPQDLINICVKDIKYPHNKHAFTNIVVTKKAASRDLWYMNFLRDCIKAEMAIDKNAIYITHDRIAHLYYRLIGGKCGFLIATESEDLMYRVSI